MPASLTEHAGARNVKATFEQLRNVVLDDGGQVDETDDRNWTAFTTRSVEVMTKTSREFLVPRGEQVSTDATNYVKVLWERSLWAKLKTRGASKFRLRIDDGRKLNISGPPINENEQNAYIGFPCIEVR